MVKVGTPRLADTASKSKSSKNGKIVLFLAAAFVLVIVIVMMMGYQSDDYSAMLLEHSSSTAASSNNQEKKSSPESEYYNSIRAAGSVVNNEQQQQQQQQQQQLQQQSNLPSFVELGHKYGTDKVRGSMTYDACMSDKSKCPRPEAVNDGCKVTGHFYDRIYQKWLAPLHQEKFQFLEIGYYTGHGFDAFTELLPMAEKHSLEIACLPPGPRDEGKWPWGNFAEKNKNYQSLLDAQRLHCGDASDYQFLHNVWTRHMKRPDAPPLKVVIEDASHLADHMATSVFFWLPRIEPGGFLVVEDVESQTVANKFRTDLLPQLMMDLHYCGLPEEAKKTKLCFPTLMPFLKAIHCELHICVLERNEKPAVEYDQTQSMPPPGALDLFSCYNQNRK